MAGRSKEHEKRRGGRRKAGLISLTIKPGKRERRRGRPWQRDKREDKGKRGKGKPVRQCTGREMKRRRRKEKKLPLSHEPQTRKGEKEASLPFSLLSLFALWLRLKVIKLRRREM